jgi:hypothetical protein
MVTKGMFDDLLNTPVIIRADASGVHYGTLVAYEGKNVRLKDSRRLWEWKIAGPGISLSEIAIYGVDHNGSRITSVLPDLVVFDICEIIPAHGMASATIEGAPVAQAQ